MSLFQTILAIVFGLVVLTTVVPFLVFMISRTQMMGWLQAFKEFHKKQEKQDEEKHE